MSPRSKSTIFLSYARPDAKRVQEIHRRLVDEGISAWLDSEDIPPGAEWEPAIHEALRSADLVLIFLSRNSVTRDGFLNKEIHAALDAWKEKPPGKIYLIPVRLEDCVIHERLAKFHWVNLFEDAGWVKLVTQIRATVAPGSQHDSGGTTRIKVGRRATDVREDFLIADNPRAIPHMVFPDEVFFFVIDSIGREKWSSLSEDTKRFVATLGCKLEPIVQIVPATPVPLVLGFECLGLGSLGENFVEICRKCNDLDAGLIRICLAVVAIKTISSLRIESMRSGLPGARNLVFSINLDPFMIESPHFKKFLKWYFHDLAHNVMFEVNETTTKQYLSRLKNLQVDYNLRYSADDLNEWHDEVRIALLSRVEMTKMDYRSFADAMAIRGEDKEEALARLYAHNLPNRPLVVEGVQDSDYLEFLERHWNFAEHGYLYGQGYILESGVHWDNSVRPLKGYGLPGGSFLLSLS